LAEHKMYYDDLSPYRRVSGTEGLNIGWLEVGRDYPKGQVSSAFLEALFVMLADRQNHRNVTRGYHQCHFCDRFSWKDLKIERSGRTALLGDAEIHVLCGTQLYVAPTLVYHYIESHGYLPPKAFVDAVLRLSGSNSADSG